MKHLYIIGNGFDIFTGLKTSYQDFRRWLQINYIFVYETFEAVYGIQNVEWWNDFEVSLGKLDIRQYVLNNTPPEKPLDEIIKENEEYHKKHKDDPQPLPSLYQNSPCADRLNGLFDILNYCMRKWINSMTSITNPKYIKIEKENSIFLNFNYTMTLELLYEIPKEQILHIHGDAYKSEKLVFGHNIYKGGYNYPYDGEKVADVLERYHKNPYEHIFKHEDFFAKIKDVEMVHVLGLSLSPVDIEYLEWICREVPNNAKWEISWYTEEDKKRIYLFVQNNKIKNRSRLIQLDPIDLD